MLYRGTTMNTQDPPGAEVRPVVHPDVAEARLLALLLAQKLRQHAEFQTFMSRVLSPVEV
jgi:hypothetical protein